MLFLVALSWTLVSRFELILLLMAVVIGLELLARRIRMPPAAAFILKESGAANGLFSRIHVRSGERGHRSAGEGGGF
jgi:hypothetical protein